MFTRASLTKLIVDLANKPSLNADELKAYFDNSPLELKDAINLLEQELEALTGASNIGATLNEFSGNTVQSILTYLKQQIDNATTGTIPDNSLTTTKMATEQKRGVAGGVASLDETGNVPVDQLGNSTKVAQGYWVEQTGGISIPANGTYVKRIPLVIPAKKGRLITLGTGSSGGIAYFETSVNNGFGLLAYSANTKVLSYSTSGYILGDGSSSTFGTSIRLDSAYIDEATNELVLTFRNTSSTTAYPLYVKLKWEVEG